MMAPYAMMQYSSALQSSNHIPVVGGTGATLGGSLQQFPNCAYANSMYPSSTPAHQNAYAPLVYQHAPVFVPQHPTWGTQVYRTVLEMPLPLNQGSTLFSGVPPFHVQQGGNMLYTSTNGNLGSITVPQEEHQHQYTLPFASSPSSTGSTPPPAGVITKVHSAASSALTTPHNEPISLPEKSNETPDSQGNTNVNLKRKAEDAFEATASFGIMDGSDPLSGIVAYLETEIAALEERHVAEEAAGRPSKYNSAVRNIKGRLRNQAWCPYCEMQ
jgi:hypothetical protein